MQKIMFNDKYCLTQAVLDGRKTMTRRTIDVDPEFQLVAVSFDKQGRLCATFDSEDGNVGDLMFRSMYRIGETVAVAQSYKNAGLSEDTIFYHADKAHDGYRKRKAVNEKGWTNKMYVSPNLMPHQIRFTDIKVEKLQDISDEDMLKEGLSHIETKWGYWEEVREALNFYSYETRRKAFAALIDKVSGKGTWDSNPYCFCYSFEIVK